MAEIINPMPTLGIVIPCYNEEEVLPDTVEQLNKLLNECIAEKLCSSDSTICFVDDGSKDKTWSLIKSLSEEIPAVTGVKLSRNRGHQMALIAGLETAKGDVLISIDADLQDDITVIKKMLQAYIDGNDVVYGARSKRDSDTLFKRFTAESYYKVLDKMGVEIIYNHADYRLLSRRALDALAQYGETNLFLRGVVTQIGLPSTVITYARSERLAGESKYPLRRMLSLAFDGISSFSFVPLRLIALLGFITFGVSVVISIWALLTTLFTDNSVPGWASSVLPIYMMGGIQLLSLGVIGEYVGKIYMETKNRPRYIIEEEV